MKVDKQEIVDGICYTELVYGRINKKLNTKYSKNQLEEHILQVLKETDIIFYSRTGKNYYVLNRENNIRITINSNTLRVITVDRIE